MINYIHGHTWRDCIKYFGKISIFNENHVTIQVSFHFLRVRASFEDQLLLTDLSMSSISGIPLHDCYTEHGLSTLFVGNLDNGGDMRIERVIYRRN